jgi:hypothetical protein
MITLLFLVLLASAALLLPAIYAQLALRHWFRPAERLPLDEAWSLRFEDALTLGRSVQQSDGVFHD